MSKLPKCLQEEHHHLLYNIVLLPTRDLKVWVNLNWEHIMITDNIPGDSVVLTAPETTKLTEKSESRAEERRSYVIRDEDDSDDDDLIDVDEESERKGKVFKRGQPY